MARLESAERAYEVDGLGFLEDPDRWDESFARAAATAAGIPGELSEEHWKVIYFLRRWYEEQRSCPPVYVTCRNNDLRLAGLRRLFPDGYQRGACKLAGLNYRVLFAHHWGEGRQQYEVSYGGSTFTVDPQGFLVDPKAWSEEFARGAATDLGIAELSDAHWKIITFLRRVHTEKGTIANVYETCDAHGLEIGQLEALFPSGYHRGAVKLAGLRLF